MTHANMRLSPHFTLREMTASPAAARRGIDNTPGMAEIAALRRLCRRVLEPVRRHYDRPVVITSGYRSPRLNTAIGGSPTSQHARGEAADFTVPGVGNLEVCQWMEANLNYDQLIYEFGESGWIHVSYRVPYRNMELRAVKRYRLGRLRTTYLQGLA
ncbi:hypothetical protein HME9302_01936 [Alteripontixanthobacter maritimus]|uniref:Peptidase M15A C-terminal domain-containing protein n=1 Tax=Alteripontixanthobacter maritimus TaxID=2161824 RepID=A0A369Q779_9SPHN|nr:D-Ala-D-Ala carboxypeptidase family metallohydrolase [Alteripontixanthobacter maritimus]RDC60721.1 hypothetical protein HME9302_01936 [Alteripontixanthobacter maritimus]